MNEDAAVASPCVSACGMDADGAHCTGCHRTLAEITAWPGCTAEEKRTVVERAAARRAAAASRN